jgi:VIT1/CCC1 family predicted Fe2+/Mn2+ transporter
MTDLSKFSYGITSSVVTSLALIVGLDEITNPKMSIIGALLLIAIADNISDSLGIHIYRESAYSKAKNNIKVYTFSNFLTRLSITLLFVSLVMFLPIQYAILSSLVLGLSLLSILSYLIAVNQKTNPYLQIFQHVGIAIVVLITSHFVGQTIINMFRKP